MSGKKYVLSAIVFFIIIAISLVAVYSIVLMPRRTTPVLMYHSVSQDDNSSLSVKPDIFRQQMTFLKENGYKVISLEELVKAIKDGKQYLPKTVAITFDDGIEDNYLSAFPVLSDLNMTATIFVITNYIGEKKGYLTWEQIRLMMKNGIDIGSHTRNHAYLPSVETTVQLWEEIGGSSKDIEDNTGTKPLFFCYPTGGFTEKTEIALKRAGYEAAFTTNRGEGRSNKDLFAIKRVKITDSDTTKPLHFRAKLSGFYNAFRNIKKGS